MSQRSSPISSKTNSPIIVLSNSDYKRPSSILNAEPSKNSVASALSLPRNWCGTLLLLCHVFVATLLVLGSTFDLIWNSICLGNGTIRPVREIPPLVSFLISLFIFISLIISFKFPFMILVSGSVSFRKNYCYKKLKWFLYSTYSIIVGGLICIITHFIIYSTCKIPHLTPFLPAGVFLTLHGLMNLRLNYELEEGCTDSMLLPYKMEGEDEDFERESSDSGDQGDCSSNV